MEEINKAYATFRERDRIASLGGGVEKIEKQHESGKMTCTRTVSRCCSIKGHLLNWTN